MMGGQGGLPMPLGLDRIMNGLGGSLGEGMSGDQYHSGNNFIREEYVLVS